MASIDDIQTTREIATLRHGIPTPPTELERIRSLTTPQTALYESKTRQLLNQLNAIKSLETWATHNTKKANQELCEPAADGAAPQNKSADPLPVAVRLGKRERLLSLTFTSTVKLLGDDTVTFNDMYWDRLATFMDAWERNNSVWFHNLPMRNLSTTLIAIKKYKSQDSDSGIPYICIRGLTEEKEIAAFYAVLTQKHVQFYYDPLRICFDRSNIQNASNEKLFVTPGPVDWTTCGAIAVMQTGEEVHYSTVGGLLEIDGKGFLMTANHEKAYQKPNEPTRVSQFNSKITSCEDSSPLVVDCWSSNSSSGPQTDSPPPRPLKPLHKQLKTSFWGPQPEIVGQYWRAYVGKCPEYMVPNAFLLPSYPGNNVISAKDSLISPDLRFVSSIGTGIEGTSNQSKEVVILAARTGTCFGTLSPNISFLNLRSLPWTRVWTMRTKSEPRKSPQETIELDMLIVSGLEKGDSGAWVIEKQGNSLLGHVIAVSGPISYVVPISETLNEMRNILGPNTLITLPSPFQHLVELACYTYKNSKDVEATERALRLAQRAVSEDALDIRPPSPYPGILAHLLSSRRDYLIFARLLCIVGTEWQALIDRRSWYKAMYEFSLSQKEFDYHSEWDEFDLWYRFNNALAARIHIHGEPD